jgi:LysM repeat protein
VNKRPGSSWRHHAAPTRVQALAGLALPIMAAAGMVSSHAHTYTVRPGDTLSGISQQAYGSAGEWQRVYAANRRTVANANLIYPGEVLDLPSYQPRHARPDPAPVPQAAAVGRTSAVPESGGTLGCGGLESLWEDAGGSGGEALTAAEIAMAESGGNQYALSPWGDVGFWQINRAAWGSMATFNAYGNARAAIIISHDGTDWSPWTTFTSGAYQGRC